MGYSRHVVRWWSAFALAMLVAGGTARAQMPEPEEQAIKPQRRLAATGRVVRMFDFEEKDPDKGEDYNPERLPRHWFLAQDDPPRRSRPGFPNFNNAAFDSAVQHGGKWSVRLDTQGGSTCLRASSGALPVFPAADYLVTGFVRTGELRHARAMVAARFTDQNGAPIGASEVKTAALISVGEWTAVRLELAGKFATAVGIEIDLLLLQPAQFEAPSTMGRHAVSPQDLEGSAWFDDIHVYQTPRVQITAATPAGIFSDGQMPMLNVMVRDLSGEGLVTNLVVRDIDGRVVDQERKVLPVGGAQFTWSPRLPLYGWYEAELTIDGPAKDEIGSSTAALVWAPGAAAPGRTAGVLAADERVKAFAIDAGELPEDLYPLLAEMLRRTGSGGVWLAIPDRPSAVAAYEATLNQLLAMGADVTISLERLPKSVADEQKLDEADPMGVAALDDEMIRRAFGGVLERFGQRVASWQVGSALPPGLLYEPSLDERLVRLHGALSKLVPGPQIVLPWRAEWPAPASVEGAKRPVDALSLVYPASFPNEAVAPFVEKWKLTDPTGPLATVVIEPAGPEFAARAGAVSLLQRAVLLWAAMDPLRNGASAPRVPRLALREPWAVRGASHPSLSPTAEVAAWMAVTRHLAGRRIVGEMSLGSPGVRCFLLAPAPGARARAVGALVAWNESASPESAAIEAYLGPSDLKVFDGFGNSHTISPADAAGRFRIPLTQEPVFIEGVDADLVRFNAGVSVKPEFAPSISSVHEHELELFNPWPVRITGEARFERPQAKGSREWTFSPTAPVPFSIGPGQTTRIPFTFAFGPTEEAGEKRIGVIVKVTAERSYPPMRLNARINVGLSDFSMTVNSLPTPTVNGPDVAVSATITNTGKTTRTLQVQVTAPGYAEQQQTVTNLQPGESAVRRFLFKGAAADLSGKRLRAVLVDVDSPERLNKYALVP